MMTKHAPAAFTFAFSLVAASTLMAQAPSTDVDAVTSTPAVHVQQANGVSFVSGGAGVAERTQLRGMEGDYPLAIEFSGKAGEMGVAKQLRVLDGSGQVVAIPDAGPVVMVNLPPGRYTVEAEFNGAVQRRTVQVGQGHQVLHWATAAASDR
jgi:hypothetical protein